VRPVAAHAKRVTPKSDNVFTGIGRQIPLPIPVPDWSKPIIVGLLLLALWFGVRAQVAAMRARRLERQRTALLRDLGAMQAALAPEVPPRLEGLALSVAYKPAEGPAAGGDFYDLFVPHPGKVAIMLGDVSGHGHEALTHAALTRYTLRAYLQAGLEPRTALALAGRVLSDPAGDRYATVALGVFDAGAGTLSYSLAGHPPPMLIGESMPEPVTACSSPPIGWGMPTGRRQTTVSLPPGTEACFFSDGLIEARRDGQQLGREHLREVLAELGPLPAAETLLEHIRAAAQGASDDMVACILSPELGTRPEPVHVEELEADMRALDKAGVRRFLAQCEVPRAEVERALQHAAEIALSSSTALLRVELGPDGSTVSVLPPSSVQAWRATPRRAAGVDQPLLEALAAG
jgi:hypothetical protein